MPRQYLILFPILLVTLVAVGLFMSVIAGEFHSLSLDALSSGTSAK